MAGLPEWVGRYRVHEVIGTGGFATVYRATDDQLDTDVAVKVLAENHSLEPEVRQRFIAEGRRLRRVRNPHLLAVHELGETDRAQPYLVLDWADRGDLARRAVAARAAGRAPTPADAREVAEAVAGALAVLHDHRLVHRDLAPRNVLLYSVGSSSSGAGSSSGSGSGSAPAGSRSGASGAPGGPGGLASAGAAGPGASGAGGWVGAGAGLIGEDERIVLADLGLSKDLAAASGLTLAAGTSGFAPPEQRRAGELVDHRADIWAASALLVWLATGEPPDDGGRWRAGVAAAGWPAPLVAVLARGLAERPPDRQPTIGVWWAEVGAALAPPVSSPAPSRRRPLLAGAAVLLVVAGVGLGVLVDRDGGPSVRTQALDGGAERTVVEDGGITVAITGPAELAVGEAATLSVEVDGADTWVWLAPGDEVYEGGDTLTLTPESPGRATVRVVAVADGRMVEARRRVEVAGAPEGS